MNSDCYLVQDNSSGRLVAFPFGAEEKLLSHVRTILGGELIPENEFVVTKLRTGDHSMFSRIPKNLRSLTLKQNQLSTEIYLATIVRRSDPQG